MSDPPTPDTQNELLLQLRASVFKALAHPVRLQILLLLRRGPICVCELAEVTPHGMPAVSKHLSQLRQAGIVRSRREGQKVFYELLMPCLLDSLHCVDRVLLAQQESRGALLEGLKAEAAR